jgi:hypothetical protein
LRLTWLYFGLTWLYFGLTWLYFGLTWLYFGLTLRSDFAWGCTLIAARMSHSRQPSICRAFHGEDCSELGANYSSSASSCVGGSARNTATMSSVGTTNS